MTSKQTWGWIAWAVLAAAGMAGVLELRRIREGAGRELAAANWTPTQAKLVSDYVYEVHRHWPLPAQYARRINYSYQLGGLYYSNTRYAFAGDARFDSKDRAKAAAPAVGQEITVYIDPQNPSEAVAERDRYAVARTKPFQALTAGVTVGECLLLLGAALKLRRKIGRRVGPLPPGRPRLKN